MGYGFRMLVTRRLKRKSGKTGTSEYCWVLLRFNSRGVGNLGCLALVLWTCSVVRKDASQIFRICFPLFHSQQTMCDLIHFPEVHVPSCALASMSAWSPNSAWSVFPVTQWPSLSDPAFPKVEPCSTKW
jgi:hypothetical protein